MNLRTSNFIIPYSIEILLKCKFLPRKLFKKHRASLAVPVSDTLSGDGIFKSGKKPALFFTCFSYLIWRFFDVFLAFLKEDQKYPSASYGVFLVLKHRNEKEVLKFYQENFSKNTEHLWPFLYQIHFLEPEFSKVGKNPHFFLHVFRICFNFIFCCFSWFLFFFV